MGVNLEEIEAIWGGIDHIAALVAEVRKLEEECTRLANACFKYNRIAQDAEHRTHITKKAMEWWRNVARGTPAPPITRRTVGKFLALVHAENEAEKLEAEVRALRKVAEAGREALKVAYLEGADTKEEIEYDRELGANKGFVALYDALTALEEPVKS